MKKITAILLLSAYLISSTELHEFLKIPALVEHYLQHTGEDSNLSFWGFLWGHYVGENKMDIDHEKDMQLPFKSHDGCASSNIVAYTPHSFSPEIIRIFNCEIVFFPAREEFFLSSSCLSSIWQPPKLG